MTRAVVLFGAGASHDYGAPTTGALTDAIEQAVVDDGIMQRVGGDVAFKEIKKRLSNYLNGPVNFEHVYHCVHELIFTFPPPAQAVDDFRPVLQPFIERKIDVQEETLRTLAGRIIKAIFDELISACENGSLSLDPLARFITRLREKHVTRVYTTNYDDFLIQAAPDLYTGFDRAPSPTPKAFDLDGFWQKKDIHSLLSLHGSIHLSFPHVPGCIGELFWLDNYDDARRFCVFSGASSDERRMDGGGSLLSPVITGLEKLSHLQHGPMAHYYAAFARDVMCADVIYVIGSGLADLHLNSWLKQARRRKPMPAILLVDLWERGFLEATMFELDRKSLEMHHGLRIHLNIDQPGTEIGNGWRVSHRRGVGSRLYCLS